MFVKSVLLPDKLDSFQNSSIKTSKILELLHIDLWGPYRTNNHNGCTHTQFLTIVDDYSRYTWIHLVKFKYDILHVLMDFVCYAENQYQSKVLCIRSDNAL